MKIKKHHGDAIKKPGALLKQIQKDNDPVKSKIRRKNDHKKVNEKKIENNFQVLSKKEVDTIIRLAEEERDNLNDKQQVKTFSSLFDDTNHDNSMKPFSVVAQEDSSNEDNPDDEIHIDEADEKVLSAFISNTKRITLADLIQAKLDEKQILSKAAGNVELQDKMDSEIIQLYQDVGRVLSKYRSGKLPKAFKALPALANWDILVMHTKPDQWTAAAMFQATRIFVSKLNAKLSEKFFVSILLPRVRDDIAKYKKLNHHLTMAIRKATMKAAAFFKGIIFPLCLSGDCTLREAVIISSIVAQCSIPILHCGAALYKLCSLEYTGSTSLFIKMLLDKRFALHYRVIDILTEHFCRFEEEPRILPVIWHQSLMSFIQWYKQDLNKQQNDKLLQLLKKQRHHQMAPIMEDLLKSTIESEIIACPVIDV